MVFPVTPGTRTSGSPAADTLRPFGTQREMAERMQRWLELRMERTLPALMRREGVDLWVVPMREYNEDPVFRAITSPTTTPATSPSQSVHTPLIPSSTPERRR